MKINQFIDKHITLESPTVEQSFALGYLSGLQEDFNIFEILRPLMPSSYCKVRLKVDRFEGSTRMVVKIIIENYNSEFNIEIPELEDAINKWFIDNIPNYKPKQ